MCCPSWEGWKGFAAAIIDNGTGGFTNVRGAFAPSNPTAQQAADFNGGLTAGDVVTLGIGASLTSGGEGLMAGSAAVTLGTGGLAVEVTAPAFAVGAAIAGEGLLMGASGAVNLANGKGRVEAQGTYSHPDAQKPLPRNPDGTPAPDPAANGPHTQLGKKEGSKGPYNQAREFDNSGKPVKDVDFTDHGRPKIHPNPHQHPYKPNPSGGTPRRGEAEPLKY